MNAASVKCPQCGGPADASAANPQRPFCSKRCKLIDLGDWFDEQNTIPGADQGDPWVDRGASDDERDG